MNTRLREVIIPYQEFSSCGASFLLENQVPPPICPSYLCNANMHSSLGYFSVSFIQFYYVCVLIWLWKCYLYSLWLIVCFLHVFRLKMCMERTWDCLEWSVKLVKSNWILWKEFRVITENLYAESSPYYELSQWCPFKELQLSSFEQLSYFGYNFVYIHPN